jgi:cysteinyl-tRNA synthetase
LKLWRKGSSSETVLERVRELLDDDLDTPGALSVMDEAAQRGESVAKSAKLLGVVL